MSMQKAQKKKCALLPPAGVSVQMYFMVRPRVVCVCVSSIRLSSSDGWLGQYKRATRTGASSSAPLLSSLRSNSHAAGCLTNICSFSPRGGNWLFQPLLVVCTCCIYLKACEEGCVPWIHTELLHFYVQYVGSFSERTVSICEISSDFPRPLGRINSWRMSSRNSACFSSAVF